MKPERTKNIVVQLTNIAQPEKFSPFDLLDNRIDHTINWCKHFKQDNQPVSRLIKDNSLWNTTMLPELEKLQQKIRKQGCKDIYVFGTARLSLCMAFGYIFREPAGYQLLMYHDKSRQTYTTITIDHSDLKLDIIPLSNSDLNSSNIAITINLQGANRINQNVNDYLMTTQTTTAKHIIMNLNQAFINTSTEAIAIAKQVKSTMYQLIQDYKARKVFLFFDGPQFAAYIIGHYLNAAGAEIQLMEYTPELDEKYQCAFLLKD